VIGFVAGFLAGISPCILPVLPGVLVAGSGSARTSGSAKTSRTAAAASGAAQRAGIARPLAVIAGLVLSFSLLVLAGSEVLSLLHLPQESLRDAGIALLALVGLGYLIPPLGAALERPFARLRSRRPGSGTSGFVLGLALGLVYVPCAGPILAAITVVGATHRVGLPAVVLTLAFATGTAVPLLAVGILSGQLTGRIGLIRQSAPILRRVGGVVLIGLAVATAFNAFDGLQRAVPSYSDALQGSATVRGQLNSLTGVKQTSLTKCDSKATTLVNCGPAPNFKGVTAWLNTAGGRPLSISALRGKVVLVDFWTYSCINCQRTLPHVEAWYQEYASDGFVVVGAHTPEFAFEHVVSNVKAESAAFGVKYPVAIDDSYGTWNAYDNEYWPADYLVDAAGHVRHVHFGEGDYGTTEQLIRQLLVAAHPGLRLLPSTGLPDRTPTGELSPETYVGYQRAQYIDTPNEIVPGQPTVYQIPSQLPPGALGLSGTWTDNAEEATAGPGAEMELGFLAHNVYLVLGGTGTVEVSVNGRQTQTIRVSGVPRLYTLYRSGSLTNATMLLRASSGVQAYDFTFG
jgi:cytochrome c biogenesis protein CcdA/thiol-disulfide isomerase/thioredoxin